MCSKEQGYYQSYFREKPLPYCLLKIENHPDSEIDEVIGPFDTYEQAEEASTKLQNEDRNYNGTHRLYNFRIRIMIDYTSPLNQV